jgi:hypothetical protein
MKVEQFLTPHSMNLDLDERALKPTECRSKMNLRSGTLEGSNAPWCENIKGTTEIVNPYYDKGDLMIGSVEDIANDAVIWFIYNRDRTKQKIVRWLPHVGQIELILKHRYLNFQKTHKIKHANIVDGLLYWTDGYDQSFISSDFNPPRKINIAKAKKLMDRLSSGTTNVKYKSVQKWTSGSTDYTAYVCQGNVIPFGVGQKMVCFTEDGDTYGFRHKASTGYCELLAKTTIGGWTTMYTDRPWGTGPAAQTRAGHALAYETDMYFGIDWQVLDTIKHKPFNRPSASYTDDSTKKINKLRNGLYQFAYQHVYDDHEKTAFSAISYAPTPNHPVIIDGSFDESVQQDNVINVWVDSGPMEVIGVNIVVRLGNTGGWQLVKQILKYDENGGLLISPDINILYQFDGNDVLQGVVQDDVNKPFDFVPQVAGSQELIEKNRLLFANYVEGYDNININVALSTHEEDVIIPEVEQIWHNLSYHNCWLAFDTADPNNPADRYFGSYLDFNGGAGGMVLDNGYTYVITVEDYPHVYQSYDTPEYGNIPEQFANKKIRGCAIVYKDVYLSNFSFFQNVIKQLVFPHPSSCVLALSSGGVFDGYTSVFVYSVEGHSIPGNSIYILTEYVDEINGIPQSLKDLKLTITKIKGKVSYKENSFKSGAVHPFCLMYADEAGRTGGGNVSDNSSIYVPYYTEKGTIEEISKNSIRWEINHQPPEWAAKYCWGYAKNITNSYFIDGAMCAIGPSGVGDSLFVDINTYISIANNTSSKFNIKLYEWQKGDRLRFSQIRTAGNKWVRFDEYLDFEIQGSYYPFDETEVYDLDQKRDYIVDGNGNKTLDNRQLRLIISRFDYKSRGISVGNCIVEVYRPQNTTDTNIYYEIDGWLPIINPHTTSRTHGVGPGTGDWPQPQTTTTPARGLFLTGDVYVIYRLMYASFPCETSSYSDYFNSEDIGIGRPNIVNADMRRKNYISSVRFGGRYIENTNTNDLSKFNSTDFDALAEKFEEIASIREDGYTLKVLQKNKPTSIFIGKSGLKQADLGGGDIVTITDSVLGSKAVWENDYGTIFPASVVRSTDYLYFYDIYNGCVVRWADNGMVRVSDYGMKKYFRDKSRALLASGLVNVNVYAAFEKEYDNYIISFVDEGTPANTETLMFHEPSNSWTSFLSFTPTWVGSCDKFLFSSPDTGKIYEHNINPLHNNFYGVNNDSYVEIIGNQEPKSNKVFNALAVHSNKKWGAPNTGDVAINSNGVEMQSRLKAAQFQTKEGVHSAAFLRDMMVSGVEKLDDLHNGRVLRGQSIKVKLSNSDTDEVVLFGVNVKSTISE